MIKLTVHFSQLCILSIWTYCCAIQTASAIGKQNWTNVFCRCIGIFASILQWQRNSSQILRLHGQVKEAFISLIKSSIFQYEKTWAFSWKYLHLQNDWCPFWMVKDNSNLQGVMCEGTKEERQEGREGSRKTYSVFLYQHAYPLMHKKITPIFNRDLTRH